MIPITPQKCREWIEYWSESSKISEHDGYSIAKDKPMTIGRVLDFAISRNDRDKIILLWEMCGLLQHSLNTILEEAEIESCKAHAQGESPKLCCCELTGPAADLFAFLFGVLPIPNPSSE